MKKCPKGIIIRLYFSPPNSGAMISIILLNPITLQIFKVAYIWRLNRESICFSRSSGDNSNFPSQPIWQCTSIIIIQLSSINLTVSRQFFVFPLRSSQGLVLSFLGALAGLFLSCKRTPPPLDNHLLYRVPSSR